MDKDISDMMNKFSDMMGGSSQSNSPNIDMNTILKLKSVMDKMNNNTDPRSNLLRSLKPYMRKSRQPKIDQYINLFSMSKVMEAFKESEAFKEFGGNNK